MDEPGLLFVCLGLLPKLFIFKYRSFLKMIVYYAVSVPLRTFKPIRKNLGIFFGSRCLVYTKTDHD